MESFFYQGEREPRNTAAYWFMETPPRVLRSNFVPYMDQEIHNGEGVQNERKNVKLRMVEMLRGSVIKMAGKRVMQNEKSIQHMLKERLRRRSHKDGFTRLHAILPAGTKGDKISIVTAAALEIMKTRRVLEDLRKKNTELNEKLASRQSSDIKIRVAHPVSGIDYMAEILHCVKGMGLDVQRVQSHFSDQGFSAEVQINYQIANDEVQKAVHKTLMDVEERLLRHQSCRFP